MKNNFSLRAWLELLRFPNLFTVPGDPLLGALLFIVNSPRSDVNYNNLLAATVSSLFIYSAGLILNDIADLKEDAKKRPMRPIVSGRINKLTAFAAALVFAFFAVFIGLFVSFRAVAISFFLLSLVFLYNFYSRKVRLLGIVNMALCRSVNIMLGSIFVFGSITPNVLAAAAGIFIYIFCVGDMASNETNPKQNLLYYYRYIPLASGFLWGVFVFGFLAASAGILNKHAVVLFVLSLLYLIIKVRFVVDIPNAVGIYLIGLIPMQASFCFATQHNLGTVFGMLLFLLWPYALLLSKKFYSS